MDQVGLKHHLSTAFHPQTDGQTERLNQTMEQYLRCYVNYKQDNWVELLPLAMIAYNSAENEVLGTSPFFANFGYDAILTHDMLNHHPINEKARMTTEELRDLHKDLQLDIAWLRIRMKEFADRKRIEGPILKEGDKTYLLRRNVKTTRPSGKLDHTKLGPFRVKKVGSGVNYELDLPKKMRIHPVFHISLLEPANAHTPVQTNPPGIDPEFQTEEFEVEKIVAKRRNSRRVEYLVKWLGYEDSESTWEPTANLNCPELVKEFEGSKNQGHRRGQAPAGKHQ